MKIDDRLKYMLIADKHFDTKDFINVLTTDEYELLKNYFEIMPQDLSIKLDVDEHGFYNLKIELKSDRVKIFGTQIN